MAHKLMSICLTMLVLILTGCLGIKVRSWQADEFSRVQEAWRYYRWEDPALVQPRSGDSEVLRTQSDMVAFDSALREHVDRRLRALGYQLSEHRAKFEVDYRVGNEALVGLPGPDPSARDAAERIFAGPNAEYEVSSKFYTHPTLGYHEISHLKLSLYDIGSKRIVWESSASRLVDNPNADAAQIRSKVDQAVSRLLADFPSAPR